MPLHQTLQRVQQLRCLPEEQGKRRPRSRRQHLLHLGNRNINPTQQKTQQKHWQTEREKTIKYDCRMLTDIKTADSQSLSTWTTSGGVLCAGYPFLMDHSHRILTL